MRLEDDLKPMCPMCPMCDSPEWFPGAACFACGWEGSAAEAYSALRKRLTDERDAARADRDRNQRNLDTAQAALVGASKALSKGDAHEAHGWLTRQEAYEKAVEWKRELEAERDKHRFDTQQLCGAHMGVPQERCAVCGRDEARAERDALGKKMRAHCYCGIPGEPCDGWNMSGLCNLACKAPAGTMDHAQHLRAKAEAALGESAAYIGTDAEHGLEDCAIAIHDAASRNGWDCTRYPLWEWVVNSLDSIGYARSAMKDPPTKQQEEKA